MSTITVSQALVRLRSLAASGDLAEICRRHHVEIVTLFGSAVLPDGRPRDIDVAVGFVPGAPRDFLAVVNALLDAVPGDHLDVMDLDRADPPAQRAALFGSQILFESSGAVSAERQMKAFITYEDTRWLRDLQLECLRS